MKILIHRWLDNPNNTMVKCNNSYRGGLPSNLGWAAEALIMGADNRSVILFSKAERLYSHNTLLSTKQINNILKSESIITLDKGKTMIFSFLKCD